MHAQKEVSRIGTSGAQFLKLGVGARACARGETMVAERGDVTNLYWNPAGIASINKNVLAVSRNELYVNLAYNFLGVVLPIARESVIGFSLLYLDSGDMEVTTVEQPEGTGDFFNWQSYCLGLSFARYLTDRLSLGATLKYVQEGAYSEKAKTFAFDLGALLDTGILGFKIGLSMSNIGEDMRFSSPAAPRLSNIEFGNQVIISEKSQLQTQSFPLPLTFRMGLATDLIGMSSKIFQSDKNRMTLMIDANDPNDEFLRSNFGFEYEWETMLAFRCGYRGISIEQNPMKEYSTSSFTFGAGIKYNLDFIQIQFDYAYADYQVLGYAQFITLGLIF